MNIHHVGIATKDLKQSVDNFRKTHTVIYQSEEAYDPLQDATLIYLETDEGLNVEFVCGDKVGNLNNKGIFYYHLCYEVGDIEKTIREWKHHQLLLISEPKPAVLFNNRKVAFFHTENGIIELIE